MSSTATYKPATTRLIYGIIGITVLQVAVLMPMVFWRIIDADEGFYLLAGHLVFHGKLLYRDFFYTQTPLIPYVYGAWFKLAGESWQAGRLLSVFFASLLGTLISLCIYRTTKHWAPALFGLAIYLTNSDIWGWSATVKTYPLAALLLFAAYMLVQEENRKLTLLGGILFGLSVDARLYVVPVGLLFVAWLRDKRKCFSFILGAALALLPNVFFWRMAPDAYVFGNLGIHSIRSGDAGLIGKFEQKAQVLDGLVGDAQFFGLIVVAAVSIFLFRAKGVPAKRSLFVAACLILICFLPTPAYLQYFCISLPFLIVAAVCAATECAQREPEKMNNAAIIYAGLVILCCCIVLLKGAFAQYTRGVPGLSLYDWRWQTAAKAASELNRFAAAGEPVLTSFPGYIFGSHAEAFLGTENQSGLACAAAVGSLRRRQLYKIVSDSDLAKVIIGRHIRVAIVGDQRTPPGLTPSPDYTGLLYRAGYRPVSRIGLVSIWQRFF